IFAAKGGEFSAELFAAFCRYYVTGFSHTLNRLKALAPIHVFYPSSVALDEFPINMREYVAAKAAGEAVCSLLGKSHPGMAVYTPRLPRLATDQTASLLPVKSLDPVPVMIQHLRAFRGLSSRG